ncbi:outer membrane protein assembly factor BamE [Sphingobium estronivorans]|uniref:outer membrane protein assembly factor BamE n=1 Tax=Sphingobium estronivorans TaxID=1577690 RepID=UPI00123ADDD8|nr:outer membrane protein assembly factor BamE [Sphingobium estronivorans]
MAALFFGKVRGRPPQEKFMRQFSRQSRSGRILLAAGLCALVLGASGCTRVRTHQGYQVDKLLVDSIQPGIDNRASVEGTLGRPSFAAQFGDQDWYYVSRDMRALAFSNPKPVAQTVLHVRFDAAGNVAAVDRMGMEQVAKISPSGDKTPTLGRHRSLFDEIFGNIGAVGAGGMGGGGGGSNTGGGPNGS